MRGHLCQPGIAAAPAWCCETHRCTVWGLLLSSLASGLTPSFLGASGRISHFTSRNLRVFISWEALFLDHLSFIFHLFFAVSLDLETGSLIFSFWLHIALFLISAGAGAGAGAGLPLPPSPPRDLCPLSAVLLPSDLGKACVGMQIQKLRTLPRAGDPPLLEVFCHITPTGVIL